MIAPTIYSAHPETGEFIGTGTADANPMEPGNWLIPAHAYLEPPPLAGEKQVAVRVGNRWSLVPDYRGVTYWLPDGSMFLIENIGDEPPAGALYVKPEIALTEQQKREAWKIERSKLVAGIVVTTASGHTFDGDEISQSRMARAIVCLGHQPEDSTVRWVLTNNQAVDVGRSELLEALTLAGLRQSELWVEP